eukprot:33297-Rhodomonas_salina.1
MQTGMTQIIRTEMNKHVDELKQQLRVITSTQTHVAPVSNRLFTVAIDDLQDKINSLQQTVGDVIKNATEAKFQ